MSTIREAGTCVKSHRRRLAGVLITASAQVRQLECADVASRSGGFGPAVRLTQEGGSTDPDRFMRHPLALWSCGWPNGLKCQRSAARAIAR
jgi:hypothetical protein